MVIVILECQAVNPLWSVLASLHDVVSAQQALVVAVKYAAPIQEQVRDLLARAIYSTNVGRWAKVGSFSFRP